MTPHFKTSQCAWNAKQRILSTDASDVNRQSEPNRDEMVVEGQTGRQVKFTYHDRHVDSEGEIICWTYRSDEMNIWLVVYND